MKTRFVVGALLAAVICAGCGEKPLTDFQSGPGKFKIKFPGTPRELTGTGRNNVQSHVFTVESRSWAYIVTYYDSPIPLPQDEAFARMSLPQEAAGVITGMNGSKQSEEFIKLQDKYQGIQYNASVTKPFQGQLRGRSYVVGNRVYNLLVLGTAEKVNGEIANGFLDSFSVEP